MDIRLLRDKNKVIKLGVITCIADVDPDIFNSISNLTEDQNGNSTDGLQETC